MINYFREGGFPMWIMLLAFVGTVGLAIARGREPRTRTLGIGAVVQIGLGLLGISAGLEAVSEGFRRHPGVPVEVLAEGLGELANNGTFGVTLALVLGIGALVSAKMHDVDTKV